MPLFFKLVEHENFNSLNKGELLCILGEGMEHKQWVLFCDVHRAHRRNHRSHIQSEWTGRHLSFTRWNSQGIRPQQVMIKLTQSAFMFGHSGHLVY